MREYSVYITASKSGVLYTGVTNDLERRIWQHKHKAVKGFTNKYNVTRLVWYSSYGDIRDAILREKQIKGWLRSKKIALIEAENPTWEDLAKDWFNDHGDPLHHSG